MQLAAEHISEFQELYRKHYGLSIGRDEALQKGLRLIRLLEALLKPTPHEAQTTNQNPRTHEPRPDDQFCPAEPR